MLTTVTPAGRAGGAALPADSIPPVRRRSPRPAAAAVLLTLASALSVTGASAAGASPRSAQRGLIRNVDLSGNGPALAASVPKIAVDPRDPARVAVVWRYIAIAGPAAPQGSQNWVCHLSLSRDGGASFSDRIIHWGLPRTTHCNAPFVDYAADGDLYIGATLTGPPRTGAHGGLPPFGRAVIRKSVDQGRTWSATVSVIATDSQARFAPNPAVPAVARRVPWDGASGVVDPDTGAVFVSSGYPAPPGGAAHSQRFYARSTDGGKTWGLIRAFGSRAWPQRWDGHMAAAHGEFAVSYIAGRAPGARAPCPCVVFGTSRDGGRTLRRHYLASVRNIDTLVHYPPIAADPNRRGAFALALVSDDARQVTVWETVDSGDQWTRTTLQEPAGVVKTSRPALAYAPNGALVAMWRAYHQDGSFDVYVAAAPDGRHFRGDVRLSTASSRVPPALLSNYAVRGDFIDTVAASDRFVDATWTDWRTGAQARVYYGRVPMALLISTAP